jgi:AraC-like DNA-binding protein
MKHEPIECSHADTPNLTIVPLHGPESHDDSGAKPEGARKIERSIAYMMQHLNEPLQVAKLAQAAHTSPSHFFALFKRWAGFSPIDYFIRLRMERACGMLATTRSVKEIAADLGYDDPFYFSRVFKSIHGVAPSDYRQMMEQLKQTDTHGGMPGPEKGASMPPLPISEVIENDGGNGKTPREKHSMLHSTQAVYLL